MLFPSEVFLFVFLLVVLGVYYLLLRKTKHLKNIFLLAASLFFYAWVEPQNVWLMVGVILFNWFFGILVDKVRDHKVPVRILMTVMVLTNVGILGWYKYSEFVMLQVNRFLHTEFTVPDVTLPIGISFFTFQAMSYVIDVYRGHGKVQKNPLQVGLYISLFPQLIAGPIVRYETIADQIANRVENLADFNAGVTRFCIGLGKKVLIANRGEIALRVMRSCREMGLLTVAVFSEADRTSHHVAYADEAYPIGPAVAKESYLNIEKVIATAKRCGADAIHPGYGFLSENSEFARRCKEEGIIFIGPAAETMEAMGDKIAARKRMIAAGVPVVPGTEQPLQSAEEAVRICNEIGYPVMLKASMGGGGKGMRLIHNESEVVEAYNTARSESMSSFGDNTVYQEK